MYQKIVLLLFLAVIINSQATQIVDLRDKMPPVKKQSRGTCSAFAATSLMEFLIQEHQRSFINLSEEYNYWAAKNYTLTNYVLKGYLHVDSLAGYLAVQGYEYGSVLEKDFPFKPHNRYQLKDPLCINIDGKYINECFTYEPPNNTQLLPYTINTIFIERRNISNFILSKKKPVIINIMWCYDALNNETGNFRLPTENELNNCAGHVITLVGYNSLNKEFVFRNSWGTDWGNAGHGTIPEEYIIKYCESCPYLSNLHQYSPERRELFINASKGISGNLIIH